MPRKKKESEEGEADEEFEGEPEEGFAPTFDLPMVEPESTLEPEPEPKKEEPKPKKEEPKIVTSQYQALKEQLAEILKDKPHMPWNYTSRWLEEDFRPHLEGFVKKLEALTK